jgi:hypothetical protein
MISSKANIFRRIQKKLRTRRAKKHHEALEQLEAAINMPRKDGRIEAIRDAWDAYMSARFPYQKKGEIMDYQEENKELRRLLAERDKRIKELEENNLEIVKLMAGAMGDLTKLDLLRGK